MDEEDSVTKVVEVSANGTCRLEKKSKVEGSEATVEEKQIKEVEGDGKRGVKDGVNGMEEDREGVNVSGTKETNETHMEVEKYVVGEIEEDTKGNDKGRAKEKYEEKIDGVEAMNEDNKVELVEKAETCNEPVAKEDEDEKVAGNISGNDAQEYQKKNDKVEGNVGNKIGDDEGDNDDAVNDVGGKDEKDIKEKVEKGGDVSNVLEEKTGLNEEVGSKKKEENQEEIESEVADSKQKKEKMIEDGNASNKHRKSDSTDKVGEKKMVAVKDKEPKTPVAPAIERPVRERKTVERLVASIEKDSAKELKIEKGQGTPLKDIPNVAFKLSRKKVDDTLKMLHMILFGRRAKATQLKSNISRFSGFVWHGNEEKQKIKIKEKFDKCNKEKLWEICDLLDIPVAKASTRKEDIVVRLIDFLVAPHVMTTTVLAEKEQSSKGKKRKRVSKTGAFVSGGAPSKFAAKTLQRDRDMDDYSEEEKRSAVEMEDDDSAEHRDDGNEEENNNGAPERFGDMVMAGPSESKEEENETESELDPEKGRIPKERAKKSDTEKTRTKKMVTAKKSNSPAKKAIKKSSTKHPTGDSKPQVLSRKRENVDAVEEKPSKEKTGKGKAKVKVEKARPTIGELRDAICEILKEVDFNTATFTDILNQLAARFKSDLAPRKSAIKLMIQEELTKLADESDDDDEEDDEDVGKDEVQAEA